MWPFSMKFRLIFYSVFLIFCISCGTQSSRLNKNSDGATFGVVDSESDGSIVYKGGDAGNPINIGYGRVDCFIDETYVACYFCQTGWALCDEEYENCEASSVVDHDIPSAVVDGEETYFCRDDDNPDETISAATQEEIESLMERVEKNVNRVVDDVIEFFTKPF